MITLVTDTVDGLGDLELTGLQHGLIVKFPGTLGVKVMKEMERRLSGVAFVAFRGAIGSLPPGSEGRQPGDFFGSRPVCKVGIFKEQPGHAP